MNPAEAFRLSVTERLETAAKEIFLLFHQSIIQYEKEIERQRHLLEMAWKPHVKLQRIEFQQQHVCTDEEEQQEEEDEQLEDKEREQAEQFKEEQEEVLVGQQLCDNVMNPEVKQEPPVMEEEQQAVNQKSDGVPEICSHEGSKDESVLWNPDGRVDTPPERSPAAEGHQHQPPTGPADQAAGLRKRHQCNTCGKQFRSSGTLRDHVRTHGAKQPFSCKSCGKCFTKKSHLDKHTKIHTGEKPYSSKSSGKSFTQKSPLDTHIMIHNGEKPYRCKACGKCFTRKQDWSSHMRVHTEEKPFVCKICARSFSWSSALTIHNRTVHSDHAQSAQVQPEVKKLFCPSSGQ